MWWLSIPLAKNNQNLPRSLKHLWIWSKRQQGPAPRLLSSSAEFCFVTRMDTGHRFLAVPVFFSALPRGDVPVLPHDSSQEWMQCKLGEGEMPQVLHCSSVGKNWCLCSIICLLAAAKKVWSNLMGLILFLLWPFQSAWGTKGIKRKEKLEL